MTLRTFVYKRVSLYIMGKVCSYWKCATIVAHIRAKIFYCNTECNNKLVQQIHKKDSETKITKDNKPSHFNYSAIKCTQLPQPFTDAVSDNNNSRSRQSAEDTDTSKHGSQWVRSSVSQSFSQLNIVLSVKIGQAIAKPKNNKTKQKTRA